MSSWTDNLTLELIPVQYRSLAEDIGIGPMIKLVERRGGEVMYIPKEEGFFRNLRDKLIREEFNGYNMAELSRRYNLTLRHLQNICRDLPCAGQMSLDELDGEQINLEETLL